MNRRLRIAAWAGLALIVATNAVALAGAAFNRAGEPQATLKLGERELTPPYVWYGKTENSGLSLRLRWESLPPLTSTPHGSGIYFGNSSPGWLDGAKMRELGFDSGPATPPPQFDSRAPRHVALPREVFIVLEFNGPAYQEYVRRAGVRMHDTDAATTPRASDLDDAQHVDSRLFAVDAGLDASALRARYPDRTMYAVVRGRVSPKRTHVDDDPGGFIDELAVNEINVPLALRPVFDGVASITSYNRAHPSVHFEATVAFGQRFEPWLASAVRH